MSTPSTSSSPAKSTGCCSAVPVPINNGPGRCYGGADFIANRQLVTNSFCEHVFQLTQFSAMVDPHEMDLNDPERFDATVTATSDTGFTGSFQASLNKDVLTFSADGVDRYVARIYSYASLGAFTAEGIKSMLNGMERVHALKTVSSQPSTATAGASDAPAVAVTNADTVVDQLGKGVSAVPSQPHTIPIPSLDELLAMKQNDHTAIPDGVRELAVAAVRTELTSIESQVYAMVEDNRDTDETITKLKAEIAALTRKLREMQCDEQIEIDRQAAHTSRAESLRTLLLWLDRE